MFSSCSRLLVVCSKNPIPSQLQLQLTNCCSQMHDDDTMVWRFDIHYRLNALQSTRVWMADHIYAMHVYGRFWYYYCYYHYNMRILFSTMGKKKVAWSSLGHWELAKKYLLLLLVEVVQLEAPIGSTATTTAALTEAFKALRGKEEAEINTWDH